MSNIERLKAAGPRELARLYDAAQKTALNMLEARARAILRKHRNLREFVMGMGGWGFWTTDDEPLDNETGYLKPVRDLIEQWDDALGLTGTPLRFTADGPVMTEW